MCDGTSVQTEKVCRLDGKTKFNNIIAGSDIVGRYTADADADLVLSNITLNDGYEAPHSITTESNVNVVGTAELKAGNSITLGPGFIAEEGTTFTASKGEVLLKKGFTCV